MTLPLSEANQTTETHAVGIVPPPATNAIAQPQPQPQPANGNPKDVHLYFLWSSSLLLPFLFSKEDAETHLQAIKAAHYFLPAQNLLPKFVYNGNPGCTFDFVWLQGDADVARFAYANGFRSIRIQCAAPADLPNLPMLQDAYVYAFIAADGAFPTRIDLAAIAARLSPHTAIDFAAPTDEEMDIIMMYHAPAMELAVNQKQVSLQALAYIAMFADVILLPPPDHNSAPTTPEEAAADDNRYMIPILLRVFGKAQV